MIRCKPNHFWQKFKWELFFHLTNKVAFATLRMFLSWRQRSMMHIYSAHPCSINFLFDIVLNTLPLLIRELINKAHAYIYVYMYLRWDSFRNSFMWLYGLKSSILLFRLHKWKPEKLIIQFCLILKTWEPNQWTESVLVPDQRWKNQVCQPLRERKGCLKLKLREQISISCNVLFYSVTQWIGWHSPTLVKVIFTLSTNSMLISSTDTFANTPKHIVLPAIWATLSAVKLTYKLIIFFLHSFYPGSTWSLESVCGWLDTQPYSYFPVMPTVIG